MIKQYSAFSNYFKAVSVNTSAGFVPQLVGMEVTSVSTNDRYLQVHALVPANTNGIPSDGTEPLISPMLVPAGSVVGTGIFPVPVSLSAPGIIVIMSSTAATLTKDTSTSWHISIYIEDLEGYRPTVTTSTVGDLTTSVGGLTVWADAAGPKRLLKLEVINGAVGSKYFALYAVNSPSASSLILGYWLVTGGGKKELNFGIHFSPFVVVSGVVSDACVVKEHDLADDGSLGSISSGTDLNIRATIATMAAT